MEVLWLDVGEVFGGGAIAIVGVGEHLSVNGSAVPGCRRGSLVIGGCAIATEGGGEHSSVNGSAVVGCWGSTFMTGLSAFVTG